VEKRLKKLKLITGSSKRQKESKKIVMNDIEMKAAKRSNAE
jgi:hypothetical protein